MFEKHIGIDLGTVNVLVHVKGRGIVMHEPSVVAIRLRDNKMVAVGHEAYDMLGRTPESIEVARPMRDGVIADFVVTEAMLRYFIQAIVGNLNPLLGPIFRPKVMISTPKGVTSVEERAVHDAAMQAGAGAAYLIPEPLAAAYGAGLPIGTPTGNMVVDMGGGTTEVAIISLAGIVLSRSVRVGGDEMDEAIVQYLKRVYNLMIGERTAEEIKITIGSAYPLGEEMSMEVKGRDLVAGLPKTLTITSEEIREALQEPVSAIIEAIRITLERCPPELSSDLVDRGIVLAGGTSQLRGMDKLLAEQTGLPVHVAEDPLSAVAEGTGVVLHELNFLRKVSSGS